MVTAKDVAKLANVSISTVSRVFSQKPGVAEGTKNKVLDAAKELGFQPNRIAQALITGRLNSIGLLVPDISNPVFAEIALGVEQRAREDNFTVILCNTDDRIEREHAYLDMLLGYRAEGVILVGDAASRRNTTKSDILENFRQSGRQILLVNREPKPGFSSVLVDYEKAMYDATVHLLKQGRTKIGYLLGAPHLWGSKQRLSGYGKALSQWGIEFRQDLIQVGGFHRDVGAKAFAALVDSRTEKIDGLLCENDLMAIGALSEIKKRQIKVPEDLAVVGFGNTYLCDLVEPSLTSIGYDAYDMGRGIGNLMITFQADEKRGSSPVTLLYDPKMTVRASSDVNERGELPRQLK